MSKLGSDILDHQEVIRLACGLMEQPDVLVRLVYERISTYCSQLGFRGNEHDTQIPFYHDYKAHTEVTTKYFGCLMFLGSLKEEISVPLCIDPLNNQYINFIHMKSTELFVPSRFYVFFEDVKHDINVKYVGDERVAPAPTMG